MPITPDPNDPVQTGDFGSLYTSDSAPKDPIPSAADKVAADLARLSKIATTGGTDPGPTSTSTSSGSSGASSGGSGSSGAQGKPNANSSAQQGQGPQAEAALLERLKPLGITDLKQLKGKTDAQLFKIAGDVARHEIKQQTLGKYFWKNPDGTWDYTKTPDGRPTGLGPDGKPVLKAGPAPAPKPAPGRPAPTKKPPAPKSPAPKKPPAPKRPPAKRPPPKKPAPKRPAPVVKRPAPSRVTGTGTSTRRAVAR